MGPAVVITIGVLFLLHEMRDGSFDFGNTYPFILIVIGGILLAASVAPMTGHVEAATPPPGAPPASGSTPGTTPSSTAGPGR